MKIEFLRSNTVVFSLALVVIGCLPLTGRSEGTFPRSWKEAVAMRIFDWYQQDMARLAKLEADLITANRIISEVAPTSTMVGTAIDQDDVTRRNDLNAEIARLRERIRRQEVSWEKNRAEPNAPERSFAGRYGPLSGSAEQIRSAIRNFPFNGTPSSPTATTAKAVDVNGTWTVLGGETDGVEVAYVTTKGESFHATSSYTVRGTPYSWTMDGTIDRQGKVAVVMTHSYAGKIPYTFQLSPDGKKFSGADINWVRP